MVIVVVRWYILPGKDGEFKEIWKKMVPDYKDGLFRELFSKPIDLPDTKYHTLDFESKHYTSYINVGVWRTVEDFDNAINTKIPGRRPLNDPEQPNKDIIELFDFEFKLRERIVMNVEMVRAGEFVLPLADF